MRLALDATLFDEATTGIALATRELSVGLRGMGLDLEHWGARQSGHHPRGKTSRTIWTLRDLPNLLARHRPSLFHATANFNLPLQRVEGVPLVLTVHDVVPLVLPHTVSLPFRLQFQAWLANSLRVASQVICVSETARASVLERFEVDASKLTTVLHGVDHVLQVPPADAISERWLDVLGLPKHFVLYAGALDARKNVDLVLRALEKLDEGGRRATLVLAGQRWFGSSATEQRIEALQARGLDVRALGYLHDSVFYALMKRASVFVFPSRYEGFGLPPLEAMQLGTPTIVSTEGSLPEVCGDGAQQVGPDDALGLAQRIDALLGSSSLRAEWSTRGLARAEQFRWATAAAQTRAVYERALASR